MLTNLKRCTSCFIIKKIINIIKPDKPDPAAAKVLQEILGGHYGEMRTMMQYFFQSQILEEREAIS